MNDTPKKLPDRAFKPNHCAQSNHVFLWQSKKTPPFTGPVEGWKIVGYGKAPWFKPDYPFAVMFERTAPPSNKYGDSKGNEMTEGTRIWQHGKLEWVPGTAEYKRRCREEAL